MAPRTQVVGISGSLRTGSYNTALLHAAAGIAARGNGVRLWVWDGLAAIPPFNEDREHDPTSTVCELRSRLAEADAVLISTPEYNSSIPGQLKNALDWASRPVGANALTGKPVAVLGASPSAFGAEWSATALRGVLAACGAQVVGDAVHLCKAHQAFQPDGALADRAVGAALSRVLGELELAAGPA